MGPKSLMTKLVRVMGSLKRVAKNGRNDFHKYDYVTESDVVDAIRESLVRENIFITTSVENSQKDNDFVSVLCKHTFIDGDTGETFEVKSLGIGQDKGDKAANKAITASFKYMLLKNFLISTGDDPEATDAEGNSTAPKAMKVVANEGGSKKHGFSNKVRVKDEPVASSDEL